LVIARALSTTLVLGLTLAAYKPPGGTSAVASRPSTSAAAPVAAAPRCPDADFDSFLKRFSADITVQEKATANPLTMIRLDPDAQPEPKQVNREVPLSGVEWPVIPHLDAARGGGLEVVVSKNAAGRQVLVRTADTGDQRIYHFVQRPCWTLVKVDDQSL